jgi:hypothetical protein
MPFATPLALLGLLFVPAVLAMYLLKLRRNEAVVPSTLLWSRLVADVEANAPWQRLRRSLLLLLQLLLVIALAVLAARPFLERPAGLAGDLVLVVDASASMGATDVAPSRLQAAKVAALDALRDLPSGGKVSVIAAGRSARVVANRSSDMARIRQAIETIAVEAAPGDLTDALALASSLAARATDAQVLIATDAAVGRAPTLRVDAPVRVLQVGRARRNQAIIALAVRPAPSGVTRSIFAAIANLDVEFAKRRLEIWGDGALIEAKPIDLDPQARQEVVVDDIPEGTRVIEARLVGPDGDVEGTPPDDLAIDDRAWAIVPPTHVREVLIVGEGDPYLETALSYLPETRLFGLAPDEYPAKAARTDGTDWDLIIFEGFLPAQLPRTPTLAIAPPRSSPLGEVAGTITGPGIGSLSPDQPVLRYVDLSTTHIAKAQKLVLPEWAQTIIPGPGGAPLLYAGERAGVRTAVLAFEPRQSDLPLQVAFPVLIANLAGQLVGGSTAPTESIAPGSPVTLSIPASAAGLKVTKPDGSTLDLAPGTVGGASVTFSATDQLGVYTIVPTGVSAAPSPSPSAPAASQVPAASPEPSASSGASAVPSGSPTPRPVDPNEPVRFAVDLFDVDESTIAPGSPSALEALGGGAASSSPSPGASARQSPDPSASASPGAGAGSTTPPRQPARDELWVPIVLIALAVLFAEWAVYQRDGLIRLRRALSARLSARRTAEKSG